MKKKKKNSYAKQVGGLAVASLGGAIGAHTLSAVGGLGGAAGTITARGQAGLLGVSKFVPTAGKVMGAVLPVKIMHEAFPKKKIKEIFK